MPYREGKKWRGAIMVDGERVTALHPTKKAAAEWEKKEKKRLREKSKPLQQDMALLTLSAKYLEYSKQRHVQKVYDEKKSTTKRLLKHFPPNDRVDSIDPEAAENFLTIQATERSKNAANKDRKNLSAMWSKGQKTWGVKKNPWAACETFPHDVTPPVVPTVEEVVRLLMAADRKERAFLAAYLHTGARRGEIMRWTWADDINFANRMVRIGTRKTRDHSMQYRWVEMSEELHGHLKWWYDNRTIPDSPYVFTDDQKGPHYGKPYSARRRFMRGLCKRAKIREFGFHSLRRFFASMLADNKEDIKTIQTLLGHSRATTTDRYLYSIGLGRTRKAVEKISFEKFLHENLHETKKGSTDEG